jgi:hypothetical protein
MGPGMSPFSDSQGRVQDFKLGGGGAFKTIAPSGGRCEHFGVFRVKIHDFTPIKQITESPSYP